MDPSHSQHAQDPLSKLRVDVDTQVNPTVRVSTQDEEPGITPACPLKLSVTVADPKAYCDELGQVHYFYKLHITGNAAHWVIERRLEDFVTLRETLARIYGPEVVPPIFTSTKSTPPHMRIPSETVHNSRSSMDISLNTLEMPRSVPASTSLAPWDMITSHMANLSLAPDPQNTGPGGVISAQLIESWLGVLIHSTAQVELDDSAFQRIFCPTGLRRNDSQDGAADAFTHAMWCVPLNRSPPLLTFLNVPTRVALRFLPPPNETTPLAAHVDQDDSAATIDDTGIGENPEDAMDPTTDAVDAKEINPSAMSSPVLTHSASDTDIKVAFSQGPAQTVHMTAEYGVSATIDASIPFNSQEHASEGDPAPRTNLISSQAAALLSPSKLIRLLSRGSSQIDEEQLTNPEPAPAAQSETFSHPDCDWEVNAPPLPLPTDALRERLPVGPTKSPDFNSLRKKGHHVDEGVFQIQHFQPPTHARHRLPSLRDFTIHCVLGRGGFGTVLLVCHKSTQQLYAMKVMLLSKVARDRQTILRVRAERQFLAAVEHPFIVHLRYAFKTKQRLYMVMDYCPGGDLNRQLAMTPQGRLPEDRLRFYAAQLVLALGHLHSLGIVFRDLKPENVLIQADGYLALSDFGLAKYIGTYEMSSTTNPLDNQDTRGNTTAGHTRDEDRMQANSSQAMSQEIGRVLTCSWVPVGTAEYTAPEMILKQPYGFGVDWWALGILLYECATGFPPFYASATSCPTTDAHTVREAVFKQITTSTVAALRGASPELVQLVASLLEKDPSRRLGSKHANPEMNLDEIKRHPFFNGMNWKRLLFREEDPPYIPRLAHALDVSHFPGAALGATPSHIAACSRSFGSYGTQAEDWRAEVDPSHAASTVQTPIHYPAHSAAAGMVTGFFPPPVLSSAGQSPPSTGVPSPQATRRGPNHHQGIIATLTASASSATQVPRAPSPSHSPAPLPSPKMTAGPSTEIAPGGLGRVASAHNVRSDRSDRSDNVAPSRDTKHHTTHSVGSGDGSRGDADEMKAGLGQVSMERSHSLLPPTSRHTSVPTTQHHATYNFSQAGGLSSSPPCYPSTPLLVMALSSDSSISSAGQSGGTFGGGDAGFGGGLSSIATNPFTIHSTGNRGGYASRSKRLSVASTLPQDVIKMLREAASAPSSPSATSNVPYDSLSILSSQQASSHAHRSDQLTAQVASSQGQQAGHLDFPGFTYVYGLSGRSHHAMSEIKKPSRY